MIFILVILKVMIRKVIQINIQINTKLRQIKFTGGKERILTFQCFLTKINAEKIIITIIFITLVGGLSLSFFGKRILKLIDDLFKRIPFLRTVYSAIVQMTETFSKKDEGKKSVVLIEYPRKGVWAVGFATKENTGEMAEKTNKKLVNVFVPTTPNPTSGFLLMFPVEDVIYLNMSFEEASKFIVSAGTSNKS